MARLGLSRMSSVLGLKVRPSAATVLPATLPPQAARLAGIIDGDDGLDDAHGRLNLLGGAHQRLGILREAGAAEARTRVQELAADAAIEADAAGDVVHVGADLLADVGDLVDEGDLG